MDRNKEATRLTADMRLESYRSLWDDDWANTLASKAGKGSVISLFTRCSERT